MLHDVPDPVGILRTMRTLPAFRAVLVVDERTESFHLPTNGWSASSTAFGTLHYLTVSIQDDGAGTGTVIRPETVRRYANEAASPPSRPSTWTTQFVLYRLAAAVGRRFGAARHDAVSRFRHGTIVCTSTLATRDPVLMADRRERRARSGTSTPSTSIVAEPRPRR